MLVRTAAGSSPHSRPALRHRVRQAGAARAWSSGSRATISDSATRPGAASDAGLAHPATEPFARQPALCDHVLRSGQQRAHRCAQPLGQAAHHGGDRLGPLRRGHPGGRLGVEEPCAVHVDGDGTGRLDDGAQAVRRPGGTRCGHVRVLDADERDRAAGGARHAWRARRTSSARSMPSPSSSSMNWIPAFMGGGAVLVGHHVLAAARHDGACPESTARAPRSGWP